MTLKKESSLHTKIRKFAERRGHYVIKIWGGGFQEAGIPDLILCVNGIFIGMEVKIDDGKPSALQVDHVLSITEAGGIGCIVWTFEEAMEVINWAEDYSLTKNVDGGIKLQYLDKANELYDKYTKG